MTFNSIAYLLFFIIVCVVYYILPHKYRWVLLLAASYFFYMCWNAKYALLMLFSTAITYLSGILISRQQKKSIKKLFLIISLVSNLGVLAIFKYFNFFNETMTRISEMLGFAWNIQNLSFLLPVGISFYTFQALSYSMDIYNNDIQPIRHFGKYALFVSFFPQLVAGPIERSTHLIPQFDKKFMFDYERVKSGLMLIGWGVLKKLIIADRVAIFVNKVYNDMTSYGGSEIAAATVLFAVQIYCDFSAYSDIARGSARVLGFDLMKNFNAPYIAKTIRDFWKRWHISLTSWFRDYLYIPLGGNRVSKFRYYLNLLIVFLVSGLWHGASFTFVIWGALHGIYQLIGTLTKNIRGKIRRLLHIPDESKGYRVFQVLFTFTFVCFAWIFFRANSISDALHAVKEIATIHISDLYSFLFIDGLYNLGINKIEFIVVLFFIALVYCVEILSQRINVLCNIKKEPLPVRWLVYLALLFSIIIFGKYGGNAISEFIYFQF